MLGRLRQVWGRCWLAIGLAVAAGCNWSGEVSPTARLVLLRIDGNDQVVGWGSVVPKPLRVQVLKDGAPRAGIRIEWRAVSGTITPAASVTDAGGFAVATWTAPGQPGVAIAQAVLGDDPAIVASFVATVVEDIALDRVTATDAQSATVNDKLPQRLRVRATRGSAPAAGIVIVWTSLRGIITGTSVTDAAGEATAEWQMSTIAGSHVARASAVGFDHAIAWFVATARPGPAVRAQVSGGSVLSTSAYRTIPALLEVVVYDAFGNAVPDAEVTWRSDSLVSLGESRTMTDYGGRSRVFFRPVGREGVAGVRVDAGVAGLDLAVTLGPTSITLDTSSSAFVSENNGSQPAVDTIPVGGRVRWLQSPFDYDYHAVVSVGEPSFVGGDFPYASVSVILVRFVSAGTYRYTDPGSGATGVLVVR